MNMMGRIFSQLRPAQGAALAFLCSVLFSSLVWAMGFEIIADGQASDMSADGQVVVGLSKKNTEVWRWTRETGCVALTSIAPHFLALVQKSPDVSDNGQIVSGSLSLKENETPVPALWTQETGWEPTAMEVVGTGPIQGLSGDGRIVVASQLDRSIGSGRDAIGGLELGTMISRWDESFSRSQVNDANFDGSLLVGWRGNATTESRQPTVWDKHGGTPLSPPGMWGEAVAVSADGRMIVGQAYDRNKNQLAAAMWLRGDYGWVHEFLGTLPGTITSFGQAKAMDLSSGGAVIVGINQFDRHRSSGFVWTPKIGLTEAHEFLSVLGLELPTGFKITAVTGVSSDGTVLTGYGQDELGAWPYPIRSFLVRFDPNSAEKLFGQNSAPEPLGMPFPLTTENRRLTDESY